MEGVESRFTDDSAAIMPLKLCHVLSCQMWLVHLRVGCETTLQAVDFIPT
jgi:hypothetical protein